MSNNSKKSSPFDVKTVEALVALMTANDVSEIYLRDGDQHLRVRRGPEHVAAAPAAVAPAAVAPTPHHTMLWGESTEAALPAVKPKGNLLEIKSETVGTFYTQPKPGEPAFVKVGDRVTPAKVVGLVEVMKTYNEIQAGCTGVIVEALVENGKYVEFNQVLFRVEPA